jgi:hypothetical protein
MVESGVAAGRPPIITGGRITGRLRSIMVLQNDNFGKHYEPGRRDRAMIALKALARVTADWEQLAPALAERRPVAMNQAGTIAYDFFQRDPDHLISIEIHDSSESMLYHIDSGEFHGLLELFDILEVEVFGDPSPELRARFRALPQVDIYPTLQAGA